MDPQKTDDTSSSLIPLTPAQEAWLNFSAIIALFAAGCVNSFFFQFGLFWEILTFVLMAFVGFGLLGMTGLALVQTAHFWFGLSAKERQVLRLESRVEAKRKRLQSTRSMNAEKARRELEANQKLRSLQAEEQELDAALYAQALAGESAQIPAADHSDLDERLAQRGIDVDTVSKPTNA